MNEDFHPRAITVSPNDFEKITCLNNSLRPTWVVANSAMVMS